MTTSEQIGELAAALAKAQGEMGGAKKDAANPFFKSKYADLASVWEACRVALSKNGLCVVQAPSADGPKVSVETMLAHTSGQWIKDTLTVQAKDDGPQAVGSAITYLRRYAMQGMTGVAPEDDDGNGAQPAAGDRMQRGPSLDQVGRAGTIPLTPQIPPEASLARKDPNALANECMRLSAGDKGRAAALFTRATLGLTSAKGMPPAEVPEAWDRLSSAMQEL